MTTTEPVEIPGIMLDLKMDTPIGNLSHYDGRDEEMVYDGPLTLGALVAELIADRLYREIAGRWRPEFERRASARADEAVNTIVQEALARPIFETNAYGERKGEAKTLTEVIMSKVEKWPGDSSKDSGGYRTGRGTNLDAMITAAVDAAWRKELTQAMSDAKAQATAKIREVAAKAFTDALEAAAKS